MKYPRFGEKAAAVEQWRLAVSGLDPDHPEHDWLQTADIHDWHDQREIEEIINQHGPLALEDAFHGLKTTFDWDTQ